MALILRPAQPADKGTLFELDRLAFPAGDLDREPAHPGEIDNAFALNQFTVCERDGVVVGMLQSEKIGDDHVYLAALAVHPQHQGAGVGRALVARFVDEVAAASPRPTASTVTSPANLGMLSLLLSNGFVVSSGMKNYFGEGKNRVYCQLKAHPTVCEPDDRVLVPVGATDHIFELLRDDRYAITQLHKSVQGALFEFSRVQDEQGLKADEAAISVGESGGIVAALTFLLGLSFTVPDYSEPLRILILVATILTVGSLQIYANSSGSLARIKDEAFDHHMKWGNLLLEFGGVLPLVIVLPAIFAQASSNTPLSLAVAVIVSIAIAAYEYSSFAITARYERGVVLHILLIATILLPVAALPLYSLTGRDTLWVVIVGVIMALRFGWLVPSGRTELASRARRHPFRRKRA